MSDEAKIQQLVRRAWDDGRPIDMGHLSEHDRVLVCKAIVDLIETISPRLKTRTSRRPRTITTYAQYTVAQAPNSYAPRCCLFNCRFSTQSEADPYYSFLGFTRSARRPSAAAKA
jgi:hypothetical protein